MGNSSRRRSFLFGGKSIPEGWYTPENTPNGVFVCVYKNNKIYSLEPNVYDATKEAELVMGVSVITSSTKFVIIREILDSRNKRWDYGDVETPPLVPGVTTTTSSTLVANDYAGKANSDAIHDRLNNEGQAVYECRRNVFLNGEQGYLPGGGQMSAIYTNIAAINSIMSIIGGWNISTTYFWCSTQYNAANAWLIRLSNGRFSNATKPSLYRVVPIINYPNI